MYYAFICMHVGTMTSFTSTVNGYWWFFHTITIFWKVWFPIHARNFTVSRHTKYIHVTFVVIALTFSVIPVGVALGTGGYVIYICFSSIYQLLLS